MYVRNLPQTTIPYFRCGHNLASYLIGAGIPILYKNGKEFCFANTEILQQKLNEASWFLKVWDEFWNL